MCASVWGEGGAGLNNTLVTAEFPNLVPQSVQVFASSQLPIGSKTVDCLPGSWERAKTQTDWLSEPQLNIF